MEKPLVIDVNAGAEINGELDKWANLNISLFINNIKTPKIDKGIDMGTLVSGIPTAFARVDLFATALKKHKLQPNEIDQEGNDLRGLYAQLFDEWKGLLAAIALDYQNISANEIELYYSDKLPVHQTANIYEPKGAFGNMLLERAPRWKDPNDANSKPHINIIKYKGKVVGATSPESLVFTSSGYRVEDFESPWISRKEGLKGKFTDPLNGNLSEYQVARLLEYVKYLQKQVTDKYKKYYSGLSEANSLTGFISQIIQRLQDWEKEIIEYADARGYRKEIGSTPPVSAKFSKPFNDLFNYKDILYGYEGNISSNNSEGSITFNPGDVLLPETAKIARINLPRCNANPDLLNDLPVYVLRAEIKGKNGKWAFFALPLTALGLNVFGKSIESLVGNDNVSALNSRLTAIYDETPFRETLEVTLEIKTEDGKIRQYSRSYSVGNNEGLQGQDIILWPNFISEKWNKYYLYSELPHNNNSQAYSAFPFVGENLTFNGLSSFRIITDGDNKPILLAERGKIVNHEKIKAELLVQAPADVQGYKYEIYESNKPFMGVRLLSPTGKEGGYLIIKYSKGGFNDSLPKTYYDVEPQLNPVTLGVDFGSTNTSMAYSDANNEHGFEFINRRISLVGNTNPSQSQLLFFQGMRKPLPSNAIRSVLTLHDPHYLPPLEGALTEDRRAAKAVVGGFPCFIDNLPIKRVTPEMIFLEYKAPAIPEIVQIHNMKWTDNDLDNARKEAFLKTLLVQVYAELFERGRYPEKLVWSYPSSMSNSLLGHYQSIWNSLATISPLPGKSLIISQAIVGFGNLGSEDSSDMGNLSEMGGILGVGGMDLIGGDLSSNDCGLGSEDLLGGSTNFLGSDILGNSGGENEFELFDGKEVSNSILGDSLPEKKKTVQILMQPDDFTTPVHYNPEPLIQAGSNDSMTEATAVANFVSRDVANQGNRLSVTFDIGGSTTDISAMYKLRDGLTMIKQNSVRFAAQRVANATSNMADKFKNVLDKVCSDFNIVMSGFNDGVSKRYNNDTAPYYFNQIVANLDNNQLPSLYREINNRCKSLLAINLYVTGLLVFYAGEISLRLIKDLYRAADDVTIGGTKPHVVINFAGKGSRLLQWLPAIGEKAAQSFYNTMFVAGFGGTQNILQLLEPSQTKVLLPSLDNPDIKYEVSKGLAKLNTPLKKPSDHQSTEIIGEEDFCLIYPNGSEKSLSFINSFTKEMMKEIGDEVRPGSKLPNCRKFIEFCNIYYKAITSLGINISPSVFNQGFMNMDIITFIRNTPEFRQAQREELRRHGAFDFVAPIIILEGMKFYDSVLTKVLN